LVDPARVHRSLAEKACLIQWRRIVVGGRRSVVLRIKIAAACWQHRIIVQQSRSGADRPGGASARGGRGGRHSGNGFCRFRLAFCHFR
jgi:hypothetical protein